MARRKPAAHFMVSRPLVDLGCARRFSRPGRYSRESTVISSADSGGDRADCLTLVSVPL